MALLSWNSFYYDNRGWALGNSTRTPGAGQNSIGSLRATLGAYANAVLGMSLQTEWIAGFCYENTAAYQGRIFQPRSSGTFVAPRIYVNSNGSVSALYTNGTEIGRSVAGLVGIAGVQTYFEVRVKHSTTVGEVEVRINGNPTPILLLTGINLGATSANELEAGLEPSGTRDFSAFYLINKTGPAPHNDFLGHIRYGILNPGGNGNASDFDGSDGNQTDNYLLVDDGSSPDDGTTYVSSSTLNERDTYAMGNIPSVSTVIYAVCPVIRARKSDAGTRAMAAVIRRSGVDYPGANSYLGLSFDGYRTAVIQDPSTTAAWTDAGVDAMELGPKVTV